MANPGGQPPPSFAGYGNTAYQGQASAAYAMQQQRAAQMAQMAQMSGGGADPWTLQQQQAAALQAQTQQSAQGQHAALQAQAAQSRQYAQMAAAQAQLQAGQAASQATMMQQRPTAAYPSNTPSASYPQPQPAQPAAGATRTSPTAMTQSMLQAQQKARRVPRMPERAGMPPETADEILSRRAASRRMPELTLSKIVSMVPESRLLHSLVEFEKKLDAVILRKKTDIYEATKRPKRLEKKLRIFVSNTHHNQKDDTAPLPGPSDPPPEDPSWTLFVRGFLMERPLPEDRKDRKAAVNDPCRRPVNIRFTQLVSRVMIELDKELYPTSSLIVWTPPQREGTMPPPPQQPGQGSPAPAAGQPVQADGFEVTRKGDRETSAKITINLSHWPPRYKVAPPLGTTIGVNTETRTGVLLALWQYIRAQDLLDGEDRTRVNCNEALRKCFGKQQLDLFRLGHLIGAFLLPPDPIVIQYPIKLTGTEHASEEVYEVDVDVDDPGQAAVHQLSEQPPPYEAEVAQLDEEILQMVNRIRQHKHKRDFMVAFHSDPVNFVSDLVVSQHNDLVAMSNESAKEEARRATFYSGEWLPQAVKRYLADAAPMAAAAAASASSSSASAPAPASSSGQASTPTAAAAAAAAAASAAAPAAASPTAASSAAAAAGSAVCLQPAM